MFAFPSVTACVGVTPARPTVKVVDVEAKVTPVISTAAPKFVAVVGC